MYLGIDFGTSGCRAVVIDAQRVIQAQASQSLPAPELYSGRIQQAAKVWLDGLQQLFQQLANKLDLSAIQRIAIDGTSASLLLCDPDGNPLTSALMYNDNSSRTQIERIRQYCPAEQHVTLGSTSGLSKALHLMHDSHIKQVKILHQADYLSNYLSNRWGVSDYHNALKLGYDVERLEWPDWIKKLLPQSALPEVLAPGDVIGMIEPRMAEQYGLSKECRICTGSTDANAAFMATRSTRPGDAVTSIGSTLVLKILNRNLIQDLHSGVYSHKLGDLWLVGGASNAGAQVLRQYFSEEQIVDYSTRMNLQQPTGLKYYPLTSIGERFPYHDPHKQPRLSPRPASDVLFLQAILEGLSEIERTGYEKLVTLGASQPGRIQTCGGGAKNPQWTEMRSRLLAIPVIAAHQTEACYGSALLALEGLQPYCKINQAQTEEVS